MPGRAVPSKIPRIREPDREYFVIYCVPHTALFASFNLPNHFGRKRRPHAKRWEFHQVEKPAVGHTANAHHSWDPGPGLSPAEAGLQPGTA